MAEDRNFVQPAVPRFDGFYDHWSMLMENLLRSKEYWSVVEGGVPVATAAMTPEQIKSIEEARLKDLKAKNYLFQAIDRGIIETILNKDSAKGIWDSMKQKYQGSTKVKRAQLQTLRREFELLGMKEEESVMEYFARTLTIVNKMKTHGEQVSETTVVEKILRSMTTKFNYVVCSIEESNDVTTLSIDELQSSLMVHEQRMEGSKEDEHVLKVSSSAKSRGRGRGFRGGRGRGRQSFNKQSVECYHCHNLGHFQYECPNWDERANYADDGDEEVLLLMARSDCNESKDQYHKVWFLDSGCSNHMCGNRDWFFDLNEDFRITVKLGDDSKMLVMGKGSVKLKMNNVVHIISGVYYIPELKNNLLSVGQLQEKDLTITFKHNMCKVYHPEKGLIIQSKMSSNKMFMVSAQVILPTCLKASTSEDLSMLWHSRYGHLSFKGLKLLNQKGMVKGLPKVEESTKVCEDCLVGKQHRDPFPKSTEWRASHVFQLIHADICGPIKPESNSHKRSNGIKRQLTASYTPQQNGVAERKNRSLLNMVRSMLSHKKMPKTFWPEAVNWSVYIQNRSPTIAVKDVTPEEAWSGKKPSVHFFRVFGSIGYVHIPNSQRKKLDDKSVKCVLLGISEESKAYKLYDPIAKKVHISRDVIFAENEHWNWKFNSKDSSSLLDDSAESNSEELEEVEANIPNITENEDADASPCTPPANNTNEDHPESSSPTTSAPGRIRTRPGYLDDYVVDEEELDELNLAIFSQSEDPTSYEEAVKEDKWKKAMQLEMKAIEKNQTWELTTLPKEAKSIGVKWVFKTKYNEKGEIDKHKARLVAKGYSQRMGIDYKEVFAPVARWDTIRTIVALAALKGWKVYQLDVKSAFLHGDIVETVYVNQPQGFVIKGKENMVYKLKRALYGLKQAPRAWYNKVESYFSKEGFEKCNSEYTLFVKTESGKGILIVSLYVDDLIFTGDNVVMFEEFKKSMKREFDMSDLGKMTYFLGVEVIQTEAGIFISQSKYAKEVLERFNMQDVNSVKTPIVPGCKLTREGSGELVDATIYKQMVGSLMYLTATRPDLMYATCLVSRYMEKPTTMHQLAVKKILRYLKGTIDLGVMYSRSGNTELKGYADSDYAGDVDDRKSTGGYVFMLGTGAISWSSKKQAVVTLSTTEAEFISAAMCACQAVWLRRILHKLGQTQRKSTPILCDNSSSIKLSKNPVLHGRSKHIDVRFHYLRDLVKDEVIELFYCRTEHQISDIMTKPLKRKDFLQFRDWLGMCSRRVIN